MMLRRPLPWVLASIASLAIAYGVACKAPEADSTDDRPTGQSGSALSASDPSSPSPSPAAPSNAAPSAPRSAEMGTVLQTIPATGTASNCAWKFTCNTKSSATTTCPTYTTQQTCLVTGATNGCTWGSLTDGGTGCKAPTCSTVGNNASEATCSGSPGCTVTLTDGGTPTACTLDASIDGGQCSSDNADKTACTGLGCTFDGGCNAVDAAACAANNGSTSGCNAVNGCIMDGGCYATGTTCNTAANTASITACNGTTGCTATGGCVSACGLQTTQAGCLATANGGCTWEAGASFSVGYVPFPNVATWGSDNGICGFSGCPSTGYPDPRTARGASFIAWLKNTPATIPWTVSAPRYDVAQINGDASVEFAYSSTTGNYDASTPYDSGGPNSVIDFTFDTPLDAGTKLGRVMFTDMHLSDQTQVTDPPTANSKLGYTWYTANSNGSYKPWVVPLFNTADSGAHECHSADAGLNAQELVAEYLFFDLGTCAGSSLPPTPTPPHWYSSETFTRDYCVAPSTGVSTAGCPTLCSKPNQSVVWRNFSWSAIIPGGTDGGTGPSIQFYATTTSTSESALGTASDAGGPLTYLIATDTTTGSYQYDISNVISPEKSGIWLRITMVMNPDSTNQVAPILTSWSQVYDCVDSQ